MSTRKLSDSFMDALLKGILVPLLEKIKTDRDLDFEIRDNWVEVYFKGHELLRLSEKNGKYQIKKHEIFHQGLDFPDQLVDQKSVAQFIKAIGEIKHNILNCSKILLEQEYEQLVIRANGYETKIDSEYFVTDRQYKIGGERFDLLGIYCEGGLRGKNRQVPMCLMEIKYGQNSDISKIHVQLERYYNAIKHNIDEIARSCSNVFRQKLELGLYRQKENRLKAMKNLGFSNKLEDFQFIIFLIDYNPESKAEIKKELLGLGFHNQIQVVKTGFALWEQSLKALDKI